MWLSCCLGCCPTREAMLPGRPCSAWAPCSRRAAAAHSTQPPHAAVVDAPCRSRRRRGALAASVLGEAAPPHSDRPALCMHHAGQLPHAIVTNSTLTMCNAQRWTGSRLAATSRMAAARQPQARACMCGCCLPQWRLMVCPQSWHPTCTIHAITLCDSCGAALWYAQACSHTLLATALSCCRHTPPSRHGLCCPSRPRLSRAPPHR